MSDTPASPDTAVAPGPGCSLPALQERACPGRGRHHTAAGSGAQRISGAMPFLPLPRSAAWYVLRTTKYTPAVTSGMQAEPQQPPGSFVLRLLCYAGTRTTSGSEDEPCSLGAGRDEVLCYTAKCPSSTQVNVPAFMGLQW